MTEWKDINAGNEFDTLMEMLRHTKEVFARLEAIASDLRRRGILHDLTKFDELEFTTFCSTREKFKKADYGSEEYAECTRLAKPAVDHHYKNNRHHTGYHEKGILGMNLLDILEMVADWKAASKRSPNLTFKDSLPKAFEKYKIPEAIQEVILNTIDYLGW